MVFGWLFDKLLGRRQEQTQEDWEQVWSAWDTRRTAAKEAGEPFAEPPPQHGRSGGKRRRRGRPSVEEAGAAGAAGVFLVGPHVDHHGGHHGGGYDGGMHGGGMHGGGGDVGGGF